MAFNLKDSSETKWWMLHPNKGWVECQCPCDAVDVNSWHRMQGMRPWPITLGKPVFDDLNNDKKDRPTGSRI